MDDWFGSLFMACLFMDCFVGIVYVTLGLEDQGCCYFVLHNMLGGSYVIRC